MTAAGKATADKATGGKATGGRRPALDGVRALAVGAVVVYHFGGGSTSWLRGGFLGVDVFFVLSGYLITGLLLAEYARAGRIDLPGFWVRRARRLVPALIPMLLVVCAWVWWASPLENYPARRSDIFWTVGYLANWHLIDAADDYFAAYTAASPLRHTWSLAIEEQFYLLWPLLLAVLLWLGQRLAARFARSSRSGRFGRLGARSGLLPAAVTAVLGIVLSALAMAVSYDPAYPATAYYRTQDRVQELFVGVLLAVLIKALSNLPAPSALTNLPASLRRTQVPAVLALGVLISTFGWMSDTGPFYYRGGALLVSVLVAVLIGTLDLAADGVLARLFSWPPAVALGRISYGVYLWHWPIVLFIPVAADQSLLQQVARQLARLGLTLLLATLSYRFLEQPVQRDRRWLTNRRRVLVAVLSSSALVLAVAMPATALPGSLARQLSVRSDRPCPGERIDHLLTCTGPVEADPATARPAVALLGDSTARSLGRGLDDWARTTGNTWLEAAWQRCTATGLLVLGHTMQPDLPATTCSQQSPGEIRAALRTYRPPVVLIVETWTSDHAVLLDGVRAEAWTTAHDIAVRNGFGRLVDEIAGYGGRAVFVELPPVGDSIGAQQATNRPAGAHRPTANDIPLVDRYNALLRQVVASRPGKAALVSVTDLVCRPDTCPAVIDGTLVRGDGTHYTVGFSDQLIPVLLRRAGVPTTLKQRQARQLSR